MAKKLIRLTEGDLHRIVKQSVKRILNEVKWTDSDGSERSYHGWYGDYQGQKDVAADDFGSLAFERQMRANKNDPNFGVKVRDLNAAEFLRLIKQGVDFTNLELDDTIDKFTGRHQPTWENITPEEWEQWMKDSANCSRNHSIYDELSGDGVGANSSKYSEMDQKNALKGGYDNAMKRHKYF